jgi:mono/diheme cytochrome c family protein
MQRITAVLGALITVGSAAAQDTEPSIEQGRYLVTITGCNNCHTEGYVEAEGKVPESEWLKGSRVGFRGPWGTSYASNLRVLFPYWSEDGWVTYVRGSFHALWPPMPWYDMQKMRESDLRSIHKFISSLGTGGSKMPNVVYPGKDPGGTYITFPGAR